MGIIRDFKIIFNFLIPWVICFLVIALGSFLYKSYISKEIHHKFSGIKYHEEKTEVTEPVNIEINGKYTRSLLGKTDEFAGIIKIADKVFIFIDYPIKFNKDRMAAFDTKQGHYGMIFIDEMFNRATIDIHRPKGNGVYSSSGWYISAPCKNRKEAVEISNLLIQKTIRDFKIE